MDSYYIYWALAQLIAQFLILSVVIGRQNKTWLRQPVYIRLYVDDDLIFQIFQWLHPEICNAEDGDEFANNSDLITGRQLAHSRIH